MCSLNAWVNNRQRKGGGGVYDIFLETLVG